MNQVKLLREVKLFRLLILSILFLSSALAQTALEEDQNAVKAILAANGILQDDVSTYVTVSGGRIEELDLKNMALTIIPDDIGQLTELMELDLSGNNITSLPDAIAAVYNSKSEQKTVYGCQITYDGECISWGNVLQTVTVYTTANLGGNQLCDASTAVSTWADKVDDNWEATQQCGASIHEKTALRSSFNWDRTGILKVFDLKGNLVFEIPGRNLQQSYREAGQFLSGRELYVIEARSEKQHIRFLSISAVQ